MLSTQEDEFIRRQPGDCLMTQLLQVRQFFGVVIERLIPVKRIPEKLVENP